MFRSIKYKDIYYIMFNPLKNLDFHLESINEALRYSFIRVIVMQPKFLNYKSLNFLIELLIQILIINRL